MSEEGVFAGWAIGWTAEIEESVGGWRENLDQLDWDSVWSGRPEHWVVSPSCCLYFPNDKKNWTFFVHLDLPDNCLKNLAALAGDSEVMRAGRCFARKLGVPDDVPAKLLRLKRVI